MSGKRPKGGTRLYLKQLLADLHTGIATAEYGRGGDERIPHSTVDELLKLLEAAGIVYLEKEDNKWHYSWERERKELVQQFQSFQNLDELKAKLDHSQALLKEVTGRSIDEIHDDNFMFAEELIYKRVWPQFVQHLIKHYPKMFKTYLQWLEQVETLHANERAFQTTITQIFLDYGFTMRTIVQLGGEGFVEISCSKGSVTSALIDYIRQLLNIGAADKFDDAMKLECSESGIFDPLDHELITTHLDLQSDLEALIEYCISDNELKALAAEVESSRTEMRILNAHLTADMLTIIYNVKLGTPLLGCCDACMFTVGR